MKSNWVKVSSIIGYNQKLDKYGLPVNGKLDTFDVYSPVVNGRVLNNVLIYTKV